MIADMRWLILSLVLITVLAASAAGKSAFKTKQGGKGKKERVCGSDGKIYENKCAFQKKQCENDASLTTKPMKFCKKIPQRKTLPNRKPPITKNVTICGSNGVTYRTNCAYRLATCADETLEVAFHGHCRSCSAANVCSNEGNENPPVGKVKGLRRGKRLKLKNRQKVCGKDGVIYNSFCDLKIQRCLLMKSGRGYLGVTKMIDCKKDFGGKN